MNPYLTFVQRFQSLLEEARALPAPEPRRVPPPSPEAPVVMIFAPHPDDECIIGALPLRLRREKGCRVLAVAVTQGSALHRRSERLQEMEEACRYLGFECLPAAEGGLTGISPARRTEDPEGWTRAAEALAALLDRHRPGMILLPHAGDRNATHQGTHLLVLEALGRRPGFACAMVETEFWGALEEPNLLVGSRAEDVADLVAALACHAGEVARNPYHVLLPSWMSDNVRRGAERVGGQGAAAPDFPFGTLYRLGRWESGHRVVHAPSRPILGPGDILDLGSFASPVKAAALPGKDRAAGGAESLRD